ncbi:Acyltransferase family protein [Novosphingobium sp. CF614]|uniref:acyltransferase family protein n=1 Tax=Novosphingobium sp. CF614 TaxID=1884364 RepID=UPI0008E1D8C9|nr:acyltransferase [Novosphingobium sp. CF614]SFF85260.1 Acyltransferase family protein [Novosphingobium sp. CF614]
MSATSSDTKVTAAAGTAAAIRYDAISIARVICILGVVYVHAWTGLDGNALQLARGTPQENLRWVLMEAFGRSAVPLLGLVSGWLVAGSARTRDWRRHVARKARTILVPMVLWNALALALVCGTAWLFRLPAPTPHSLGWVIEEIFILTRNPDVDVQMPFLRDLFLCMVAAPLLVRMPNRMLGVVIALAAACQILGAGPPVLMRPATLMFFTLGIAAHRGGVAERTATWPLPLAAVPFAVLMPVQLWLALSADAPRAGAWVSGLDLLVRIAASLCFWRVSWALARSSARGALLKIEPFVFLLFCSHLILIWLGGPLLGQVFGKLGAPGYPAYLLVQPLLVLACVIALGSLLQRAAPGLAGVLSGGRLKPRAERRGQHGKRLPALDPHRA